MEQKNTVIDLRNKEPSDFFGVMFSENSVNIGNIVNLRNIRFPVVILMLHGIIIDISPLAFRSQLEFSVSFTLPRNLSLLLRKFGEPSQNDFPRIINTSVTLHGISFQPPTGNPYFSMEVFPIETHLLKVIDIHDILTEKKEFKTNEYLPIETLKIFE